MSMKLMHVTGHRQLRLKLWFKEVQMISGSSGSFYKPNCALFHIL